MYKKNIFISIVLLGVAICGIAIGIAVRTSKYTTYINRSQSTKTQALCKDCNIILITIDTCSARNLPCYGYNRDTTPALCTFAKNNQLFLNSYANATWTLPSHASIMTGLLPWHHTVLRDWIDTLPKTTPLLPEVLQNSGYNTVLFQDYNSGIMPLDTVYNRGITEIDNDFTIDRIFTHLDRYSGNGGKTFISYYNTQCHEPNRVGIGKKMYTNDYFPGIPLEKEEETFRFTPELYIYMENRIDTVIAENQFGIHTPMVKKLFDALRRTKTFDQKKAIFFDRTILPDPSIFNSFIWGYTYDTYIDVKNKSMMEYLRALYDEQLYKLDQLELKRFFNQFEKSQYYKNTIVILTSQHGQEFGEHGVFGHATLYEGNIKVPLIFSIPELEPNTFTNFVEGVDIMPTLLDLVGIPHSYHFDGISLAPLFRHSTLPDRVIVANQDQDKLMLRKGEWKVIVNVSGDSYYPYEVYQVSIDPDEKENVIASHFDIANAYIQEYKRQYGIKDK